MISSLLFTKEVIKLEGAKESDIHTNGRCRCRPLKIFRSNRYIFLKCQVVLLLIVVFLNLNACVLEGTAASHTHTRTHNQNKHYKEVKNPTLEMNAYSEGKNDSCFRHRKQDM